MSRWRSLSECFSSSRLSCSSLGWLAAYRLDGQRCAQLVEDGQRHRRPDADMQQPARQQGAEPQQQDVAPQHACHAQQAPEHRVLQADVAVQIELFIRVVPPAAAVHPLEQLGRHPLHHGGVGRTAEEEGHRRRAQVGKAHRHQHSRRAVDEAERPDATPRLTKARPLMVATTVSATQPRNELDQIDDAEGIKIQLHCLFPFPYKRL